MSVPAEQPPRPETPSKVIPMESEYDLSEPMPEIDMSQVED